VPRPRTGNDSTISGQEGLHRREPAAHPTGDTCGSAVDRPILHREAYNASHGSIGGTPGYNLDMKGPEDGGEYDYTSDRVYSLLSDREIREDLRAAGFQFVLVRPFDWYGISETRPPVSERTSFTSADWNK
jgi:hypothetical protein